MKTHSNRLLLLVQTVLFLFIASVAGCKDHHQHGHHHDTTTTPAAVETTTPAAAAEPTTTTTAAASSSSSSSSSDNRLIAYIADWALPDQIAWDKLDQVIYSFAVPDQSGSLGQFNADQLKSISEEAHDNDKSISLSIGGWTGSLYFSSLVASESSRTTFAQNIADAVDEYDLNAINLDWEYPNSANGVACNENDPQDTANYLKFVQLLRETLPEGTEINAAVSTTPFNDENQTPSTSLDSAWKEAMDAFYIMGYDINGNWNEDAGPNAPLHYDGQSDGIDSVSVDSAVKAWTEAGIPAEQLYLGVPFYGRVGKVASAVTAQSGMYVALDGDQIQGDEYDEKSADPCPGAVSTYSGMYQWRSIEEEGIPTNSSGWKTSWDSASMTPYAYKGTEVLSFDDPHSLREKVKYAKANGLGGVMLWSLEMDDADHSLLNALQGIRKD
ncbi:glycoside hydrolase superfamily [Zychaea mexicana]|uniref:glycoside hydrolase superfamily n=1 Tax=Zychaea mexicana TaxID=64656 RepID=UPI0022FF1450|nr:glycoside hydrolase superfamily [Zychaea mexicana]KAI9479574.1 glycoside hydrolase superfamily [Zychaea mexicana]